MVNTSAASYFFRVVGTQDIYLWSLRPQDAAPGYAFLALQVKGQPDQLSLADAFSHRSDARFAICAPGDWWGQWQALVSLLNSRHPNHLYFVSKFVVASIPFYSEQVKTWDIGSGMYFEFEGGIEAVLGPNQSSIQFAPRTQSSSISFHRDTWGTFGSSTALNSFELDPSEQKLGLRLRLSLDGSSVGLGQNNYERAFAPVIEYVKLDHANKLYNSVRAPVFDLQEDATVVADSPFGEAQLFLNPLRLLFDPMFDDFTRFDIKTLGAVPAAFPSASGAKFYLEGAGPGVARFVLSKSLGQSLTQPKQPNMCIDGILRIAAPFAKGSPSKLVLGAQATEYFEIGTPPPDYGDFVEFKAGSAATYLYSPNEQKKVLSGEFTTSWIRLFRQHKNIANALRVRGEGALQQIPEGQELSYVRQPEIAPLFKSDITKIANLDRFLFEDFAKSIIVSCPFPSLPRGRMVDGDLKLADELETIVIGPNRHKVIDGRLPPARYISTSPLTGPIARFRTPHGILVETQGGIWTKVYIACGDNEVWFERPDPKKPWQLQEALEQPNVFLVIPTLADSLESLGELTPAIAISKWKFGFRMNESLPAGRNAFDPATAPFIVIKFVAPGIQREATLHSLLEMARDIRCWSLADVLYPALANTLRDALVSNLTKLVNLAAQRNTANNNYEPAKSRILDPHWNGIACFNLSPLGFPEGAIGIRVGISKKKKEFLANYLFIDSSPTERSASEIKIGRSTLVALIDYPNAENSATEVREAQKEEGGNSDQHSCVVRTLELLIVDSRISRFECLMEFGVASFMGGKTSSTTMFDPAGARLEVAGGAGDREGIIALTGRYESILVNGQQEDRYSFTTTDRINILFESSFPVIKNLEISRAALSSKAQPPNPLPGDKQTVEAKLSLMGSLNFKPCADLIDIESLEFSDSNFSIQFVLDPDKGEWKNLDIGFDPGDIRFGLSNIKSGSLSKWPLKLRGILWSGRRKRAETSSAGAGLMQRFGFFPIINGPKELDFGLDFDIDFGSLGNLAGLGAKLEAGLAFGWNWPANAGDEWDFAFGFKFRGADGKLEVGIQNVIRLLAENVKMSTSNLPEKIQAQIILRNARVEILGRAMPPGEFNVLAFVPKDSSGKVGWLLSERNLGDVAGLTIRSLAIGQRVTLNKQNEQDDALSTKEIVEAWSEQPTDPNNPLSGKIVFNAEAGWTLAIGTTLGKFADVDIAMVDSAGPGGMYGIRVRIPGGGARGTSPLTFDIDVLYQRVSEHVGVYSTEIELPLRQLDFGAVTVTLPVLNLDVYTNGDWRFEAGMPKGEDFSRSANIQIFPFIGYGGFYIGERSGVTLTFAPKALPDCQSKLAPNNCWDPKRHSYSPILEFGVAARVGFGKEISKGPLRAGVSLTVYSVFQGVFGTYSPASGGSDPCPDPCYEKHWRLAGRAGIMLEAFGYVDFGIVKAGVFARAWAESGLTLEPGTEILLYVELGIVIAVEVVIAEIDIPFDGSFQIKVQFSFSTVLHEDFNLGRLPNMCAHEALGANHASRSFSWDIPPTLTSVDPILLWIGTSLTWTRRVEDGAERTIPVVIASLLTPLDSVDIDREHPIVTAEHSETGAITQLGIALLQWILKPSNESSVFSTDDFAELDTFLDTNYPTWPQIQEFVEKVALTFMLKGMKRHTEEIPVDEPGSIVPVHALPFPWLPGLGLNWTERNSDYLIVHQGLLRPQQDVVMISDEYLLDLQEEFMNAREYFLSGSDSYARLDAIGSRAASEQLFIEWVMTVVRVLVGRARLWVRDQVDRVGKAPEWGELIIKLKDGSIGTSDIESSFQAAARLVSAGLRLPDPANKVSFVTQSHLTGLVFDWPRTTGDHFYMEPTWAVGGWLDSHLLCVPDDWWWPIVRAERFDRIATILPEQIVSNTDLERVAIGPAFEVRNLIEALGRPQQLVSDGNSFGVFHPLPASMRFSEVRGAKAYAFYLNTLAAASPGIVLLGAGPMSKGGCGKSERHCVEFYWAAELDVIIRQVPGIGSGVPLLGNIFEIVGTSLETRQRMAALLTPSELTTSGVSLDRLPIEVSLLVDDPAATNDDGKATESRTKRVISASADWNLLAICTNLSTETFPLQGEIKAMSDDFDPVASLRSDWESFFRVLYRQSLTNDLGFYVHEDSNLLLLKDLFTNDRKNVRLTFLVSCLGGPVSNEQDPQPMPAFATGILVPGNSATLVPHSIEFDDPQLGEALPTCSPGTLSITVDRKKPTETTADLEPWYLAQKFHLMDYFVDGDGDAKVDRNKIFPIFPSTIIELENRTEFWRYDVAIPYVNFMQQGSVPKSRYVGIGEKFNIHLGFRDSFGNLLPRDHLAKCNIPFSVLYRDAMVRLQDIPGLSILFGPQPTISESANNLFLALHFRGRSTEEFSHGREILLQETIRQVELAIDQYNQPEVKVTLQLFGFNIIRADLARLKVSIVDEYLRKYEAELGKVRDNIKQHKSFKFDDAYVFFLFQVSPQLIGNPGQDLLTPLSLRLQVRRSSLVDFAAASMEPRVASFEMSVLPAVRTTTKKGVTSLNTEKDWSDFETALRATVDKNFCVARLLDKESGRDGIRTSTDENESINSVWIINPAFKRLQQTRLDRLPQFAPQPLAQRLMTGKDYHDNLHEFDADAVAANLLELGEFVLNPNLVTSAFSQPKAETEQLYRDLLAHKQLIARSYGDRVRSIFKSSPNIPETVVARWQNEIANNLRSVYDISTVAVVQFDPIPQGCPAWERYSAVGNAYYGRNANEPGIDLGMIKVSMPTAPTSVPNGVVVDRYVSERQAATVNSIDAHIRYIEETLESKRGDFEKPKRTRWFKLINPINVGTSPARLENIQRRLPQAPVIQDHFAKPLPKTTVQALGQWNYKCTSRLFRFLVNGNDQFVISAKLYHGQEPTMSAMSNDQLANILAQASVRIPKLREKLSITPVEIKTIQEIKKLLGTFAQALSTTLAVSIGADDLVVKYDPEDKQHWESEQVEGGAVDVTYTSDTWTVSQYQAVFPTVQVLGNAAIQDINCDFILNSAAVSPAREAAPNYSIVIRKLEDETTDSQVPSTSRWLNDVVQSLCGQLAPSGRIRLDVHARLATKLNFSQSIDWRIAPSQDSGWGMHPLGIFHAEINEQFSWDAAVGGILQEIKTELAKHIADLDSKRYRYVSFDVVVKSPAGDPPFHDERTLVEIRNAYTVW